MIVMRKKYQPTSVLIVRPRDYKEEIAHCLPFQEYKIVPAETPEEALRLFRQNEIQLILVWDHFPDNNIPLFIQEQKSRSPVPVILLSAEQDPSRIVGAFLAGADDYFEPSLPPRILSLRLQAVLRGRGRKSQGSDVLRIDGERGSWEVHKTAHKLMVEENELSLTSREWHLLNYLIDNQNQVISREQIMDTCFPGKSKQVRIIDNHVKNLRAKIPDPQSIETIRGVGYRFSREVIPCAG